MLTVKQNNLSAGRGGAKQSGISLVELIIFIVIVSVGLTGILLVMNVVTRGSADPLIHKQALAIAESLLEEVELKHFTFCDPDDANAATAAGPGGCATTPEALGPETIAGVTETRTGAGVNGNFDNVNDYNGFSMTPVVDINGTAAVTGYTADVAVTPTILNAIPAAASLLITVTVTGHGEAVVLEGYRTRYAPNALP
ncbi:MAG: type II secretion system protein [Sideroxydans sp.]|nr:type II secretion system protein [Sideroxydans sp.]